MIEGVIFDLDGTLIDSEPLWHEAKIETFGKLGYNMTIDNCLETQGLPSLESVEYYLSKFETDKSINEVVSDLNALVLKFLEERVELKEGVTDVLNFFKEKNLPMAICSSSPFRMIQTAVEKLKIQDYFKFIYSADFERYGKPHPGIYISTAKKLKVERFKALAFEDSFFGLLAAKSARISSVAILEPDKISDTKYDFADMKIESFHNFGATEFEYLNSKI